MDKNIDIIVALNTLHIYDVIMCILVKDEIIPGYLIDRSSYFRILDKRDTNNDIIKIKQLFGLYTTQWKSYLIVSLDKNILDIYHNQQEYTIYDSIIGHVSIDDLKYYYERHKYPITISNTLLLSTLSIDVNNEIYKLFEMIVLNKHYSKTKILYDSIKRHIEYIFSSIDKNKLIRYIPLTHNDDNDDDLLFEFIQDQDNNLENYNITFKHDFVIVGDISEIIGKYVLYCMNGYSLDNYVKKDLVQLLDQYGFKLITLLHDYRIFDIFDPNNYNIIYDLLCIIMNEININANKKQKDVELTYIKEYYDLDEKLIRNMNESYDIDFITKPHSINRNILFIINQLKKRNCHVYQLYVKLAYDYYISI